jgi:hypothetical protein
MVFWQTLARRRMEGFLWNMVPFASFVHLLIIFCLAHSFIGETVWEEKNPCRGVLFGFFLLLLFFPPLCALFQMASCHAGSCVRSTDLRDVLSCLTSRSRLHKMGLFTRFRRAFVGWENMGWIWSEKVTWRLFSDCCSYLCFLVWDSFLPKYTCPGTYVL